MKKNEICSIADCNRSHVARGYCNKHYNYYKRKGIFTVRKSDNYGSHNMHGTSEYNCWCNMKSRCYNPTKKGENNWKK